VPVALCVLGGHHLRPLAERLAHMQGGVAAHHVRGHIFAKRLIVLSDATDLAHLTLELDRIEAEDRLAVAIDAPAAALSHSLSGWTIRQARARGPLHLWNTLLTALNSPSPEPAHLRRAFLSHAVADEAQLAPVVDYLRRFTEADPFVCADSIRTGERWRARIAHELAATEVFVLLTSEAAARSTFVAFEAGWATAAEKTIRVISLDGSPPPLFVGHLHVHDLERQRRTKPWLSSQEALLDALLDALGADAPA
jgi:hypothetical protein